MGDRDRHLQWCPETKQNIYRATDGLVGCFRWSVTLSSLQGVVGSCFRLWNALHVNSFIYREKKNNWGMSTSTWGTEAVKHCNLGVKQNYFSYDLLTFHYWKHASRYLRHCGCSSVDLRYMSVQARAASVHANTSHRHARNSGWCSQKRTQKMKSSVRENQNVKEFISFLLALSKLALFTWLISTYSFLFTVIFYCSDSYCSARFIAYSYSCYIQTTRPAHTQERKWMVNSHLSLAHCFPFLSLRSLAFPLSPLFSLYH